MSSSSSVRCWNRLPFAACLFPGESLVLFAGFLAGQGVFDLEPLILVVACGAAIGDNIGYELGRHLGRPWAVRYGERLGMAEQRLQRAEAFFSKHGGKVVSLERFVGFARALVPFVAGSVRMRYVTFLIYNAVGAALLPRPRIIVHSIWRPSRASALEWPAMPVVTSALSAARSGRYNRWP